ncbi:hypothetical protein Q6257_28980, partial [Klebsiella variicola]
PDRLGSDLRVGHCKLRLPDRQQHVNDISETIMHGFIGYFYILTFIIGFGAILLVSTNPAIACRVRRCS